MAIDKAELERQKKNEETTKLRLITPVITNRWAGHDEDLVMEYYITNGRIKVKGDKAERGEPKKADYLLLHNGDIPLAVVEAKASDHDASEGYQQAIEYAKLLEAPFAYTTNGNDLIEEDLITGTNRQLKLSDFPTHDVLWQRFLEESNISADELDLVYQPNYVDTSTDTPKKARYYQKIAIKKVLEAVYNKQNRILLVMATGTGKTFVCFQIVWALKHSKAVKKVLYLVDRTSLADQTMTKDFKPFVDTNEMVLVDSTKMNENSAFDIHLALYQQIKNNGVKHYKNYAPDYFDLIIVDECHRGSVDENSEWHEVLEYFSSAIQLGVTATPKETEDISTQRYFGEAVYTYSLKQGIEDGFLAPYRLFKMNLDIDKTGYKPQKGELDIKGNPLKKKLYKMKDFDQNIIVESRRDTVAKKIASFIRDNHLETEKAIVFCVDRPHAADMVLRLKNLLAEYVKENSDYIIEITSSTGAIGKNYLKDFIKANIKYPVIAVTAKLMSTGVDSETCKTIFLDKCIDSMTEFKQTIGRGTRVKEKYTIDGEERKKYFFNIVDFRHNYEKFKDNDFDGEPEVEYVGGEGKSQSDPTNQGGHREKLLVKGSEVEVDEDVVNLDENGNLVSENEKEQIKNNILDQYPTITDFKNAFKQENDKGAFLKELVFSERYVKKLEESFGYSIDLLDIALFVAYDVPLRSKEERLNNIYVCDEYKSLEGDKRKVVDIILKEYLSLDFNALKNREIFKSNSLAKEGYTAIGVSRNIFDGKKENYIELITQFEKELYKEM